MTNFPNPKPYINEDSISPKKPLTRKEKLNAIKEAFRIIQENDRLVKEANKSNNENFHR